MPAGNDIAFVTLGCSKNEVDTDKMRARLSAAGFTMADDPTAASLVIVNTCSFLASAVEESLDAIFELTNARADAKILVAGCMPARYGDDLEAELDEVAGFLPASEEDRVVEKVEELLGLEPSDAALRQCLSGASTRTQSGPYAYVKISDGCDRFCSYCMIPYIRGRYHSFTAEAIMEEVSELVESGTREIVFIGQDTGIWGHDLPDAPTTADLLSSAAERFPQTWFRLLYLQPEGITDELLDVIASHENVCSYLDMPLQHADPEILRRMNRSGSSRSYLDVLARVREKVPGITTRTTFMAGFPGETQAQFEELLDFADEAGFDYAVVFPYSREEGSAAAGFDGQLDEDEKVRRAQELLDVCSAVGHARTARRVGQSALVLVEGYEQTDVGLEALCRFQGQAPEVDGQVHVPIDDPGELPIGSFAHVRFVDSFYYELEGELEPR